MTLFLKPAQGVALARACTNLNVYSSQLRSIPPKTRGAALGLLLNDVYATEAVDRDYLMRNAAFALNHLRSGKIKQAGTKVVRLAWKFRDVLEKADFELLSPTHPNALRAMREIDADRRFRVFGFGESHARKSSKDLTTLERFAQDILPYLVKDRGVTLLGIEMFPVDFEEKIESFLRSDSEDPRSFGLGEFLDSPHHRNRRQFITFLKAVHSLRREGYPISVRGLMPPSHRSVDSFQDLDKAIQFINDRSEALILEAKRRGQSIALYNGFAHTASAPPMHPTIPSYAKKMLDEGSLLPSVYLDIPLFVGRSFLKGVMPGWYVDYPEEYIMVRSAPTEGVYVRRWGENRVSIVFGKG